MCEQHRQCHCIKLSTGVCCLFKKIESKERNKLFFFVLIMLKPNQTNKSCLQKNHERGGGHFEAFVIITRICFEANHSFKANSRQ